MKKYVSSHFVGERALFKIEDSIIDDCLFDDGESPLKEGKNLTITNSVFGYKYPLWYGNGHRVSSCHFAKEERAGMWYTDDSVFENCFVEGVKNFRKCNNLMIRNTEFANGEETLWWNKRLKLENVKAKGDYFGMGCQDVEIDNFMLKGNYAFDGGKNIVIRNSILETKDAFWNSENVLIENCTIIGEYFAWNSKNLTIRNSKISSHQGFCYIENLMLENVELPNTDLSFEYCKNINAEIKGTLLSIKNPLSGKIEVEDLGEYIQDDNEIDFSQVEVEEI